MPTCPLQNALRRFTFVQNDHAPTASTRHPLTGTRATCGVESQPVLRNSALASSVSGSLREGPGSGFALHELTSGLLTMPVAHSETPSPPPLRTRPLLALTCLREAQRRDRHRLYGKQNARHPEWHSFRGHVPTAHTLACLRFADPVAETVARLTTGSGGLTPGRAGFAPAGRRIEVSWSHRSPPIPIDQQGLVALNALPASAARNVETRPQVRSPRSPGLECPPLPAVGPREQVHSEMTPSVPRLAAGPLRLA